MSGRTMKMADDSAGDQPVPLGASKRARLTSAAPAPHHPPPRAQQRPVSPSAATPDPDADIDAIAVAGRVIASYDAGDSTQAESQCYQILTRLKAQVNTPSNTNFMLLMLISKSRPLVFAIPTIQAELVNLLRRDCSGLLTGCPPLGVLVCGLLNRALDSYNEWPLELVEALLEDSIGARSWVDQPLVAGFVANILSAFPKLQPPSAPKPAAAPPKAEAEAEADEVLGEDEVIDEELDGTATAPECAPPPPPTAAAAAPPGKCRYPDLQVQQQIHQFVVNYLGVHLRNYYKESLQARQLILTFLAFVNVPGIREMAATQLSTTGWLQSPSLARPAKELLKEVARHCTTQTEMEHRTVDMLLRIQWRTTQLSTLSELVCVLVQTNPNTLGQALEQCLANEMSMAHSNLKIIQAACELAPSQTFASQQMGHALRRVSLDERSRSGMKPLVRKLNKQMGDRLDMLRLAVTLVPSQAELQILSPAQQLRWSGFLLELMLLLVQLRASPLLCLPESLKSFVQSMSKLHLAAVSWLADLAVDQSQRSVYLRLVYKSLMLEPFREYVVISGPDASSEHEKRVMTMLIADIVVPEQLLVAIVRAALKGSGVVSRTDALDLVEQLLARAVPRHEANIQSAELISLLFELCVYSAPALHQVSEEHGRKPMAQAETYWRACILCVVIACCNTQVAGLMCWEQMPTIRALMECVITNSWKWPPLEGFSRQCPNGPLITDDAMIVGAARLAQAERDYLTQLDRELQMGSGARITQENSHMAEQLIMMDHRPDVAARRPPQKVIASLEALSTRLSLGNKLRQSREPDFLLETMKSQAAGTAMAWLNPVLTQEPDTVVLLPIDCLCGLLHGSALLTQESSSSHEGSITHIHDRVLEQIRSKVSTEGLTVVLDCFGLKLHSREQAARLNAHRCLRLIADTTATFSMVARLPEGSNSQVWLEALQRYESFQIVGVQIVAKALQYESDSAVIQHYLEFLLKIALSPESHGDIVAEAVMAVSSLLVNRRGLSRFVMGQQPEPTCSIVELMIQMMTGKLAVEFSNCSCEICHLSIPKAESKFHKPLALPAVVCDSLVQLLEVLPPDHLTRLVSAVLVEKGSRIVNQPQIQRSGDAQSAVLLHQGCAFWLCRSSHAGLAAIGVSFLSPKEGLDVLVSYGLPESTAVLIAEQSIQHLDVVTAYPAVSRLRRQLSKVPGPQAAALLNALDKPADQEMEQPPKGKVSEPDAFQSTTAFVPARASEVASCLAKSLEATDMVACSRLMLGMLGQDRVAVRAELVQALEVPSGTACPDQVMLPLVIFLNSTGDRQLSLHGGMLSTATMKLLGAPNHQPSSVHLSQARVEPISSLYTLVPETLAPEALAHSQLVLQKLLHHSGWQMCFQMVDQLLAQAASFSDGIQTDPTKLLDLVSAILWHPNGCATLWRNPHANKPREPMLQLTETQIEQLVWWIVQEGFPLQYQAARLELLRAVTAHCKSSKAVAVRASNKLKCSSAQALLACLVLDWPGANHLVSNLKEPCSQCSNNLINAMMHRLLSQLAGANGALAFRKLKQLAWSHPELMKQQLASLAAVVQSHGIEPLSTWSMDPQNNVEAAAAANLLVRALGLLESMSSQLQGSRSVVCPLVSQIIASIAVVAPLVGTNTQLRGLLDVVMHFLQLVKASGSTELLAQIEPQLHELAGQTSESAPTVSQLVTELTVATVPAAGLVTHDQLERVKLQLRGLSSASTHWPQHRDWSLSMHAVSDLSQMPVSQRSMLAMVEEELIEITAVCHEPELVARAYQLLVALLDCSHNAERIVWAVLTNLEGPQVTRKLALSMVPLVYPYAGPHCSLMLKRLFAIGTDGLAALCDILRVLVM